MIPFLINLGRAGFADDLPLTPHTELLTSLLPCKSFPISGMCPHLDNNNHGLDREEYVFLES